MVRCGHCKALQPEFEKAATTLNSKKKSFGRPVKCAAVDAAKNTDLAKRFSITGYPWVKLFLPDSRTGKIDPKAQPLNYPDSKPREAAPITEWALRQSGRSVRQLPLSNSAVICVPE